MNPQDIFQVAQSLVSLGQAHWPSVSAVAAGLAGIVVFLKQKAYAQALVAAEQVAKQVAVLELDDAAKRKAFEDGLYSILPSWASKFVTQAQVEQLMDQAFATLKATP